jgi:hypothetical protein
MSLLATFTLENESLHLTFARDTGALVGVTAVQTGWQILNRAHLGLSFRLLVPLREQSDWHLPGQRNNSVYGEKQALTALEIAPDQHSATLVWDGVTSEHGGQLDIRVTMQVALTARQAVFSMAIDNHSPYVVESVYCPYLGDVQHPPAEEWMKAFLYSYATAQEWPMWPTFQNMRGYYGVDRPCRWVHGRPRAAHPPRRIFSCVAPSRACTWA